MDITVLFKANVKTIKTRTRTFGGRTFETEKVRILAARDRKCEFTSRSRDIVQQISRLREFLLRHKKGYLNISNFLSDVSEMTDSEREDIENRAQKILSGCSAFLDILEKKTPLSLKCQYTLHKLAILESTRNYLKEVNKTYLELKKQRLQRNLQMREFSKIESKKGRKEFDPRLSRIQAEVNEAFFLQTEEFSPEELQMFEFENNKLYNDLNSLTDEIQQIERKVVKIAELQDVFTEKVLEQDKDIDRIGTVVTGTTENVKDANQQIRRAIQRNAGLRVWILFFLLVISFSMLFLDWYND